jgi:hypothetical protein
MEIILSPKLIAAAVAAAKLFSVLSKVIEYP